MKLILKVITDLGSLKAESLFSLDRIIDGFKV